MLNLQFPGTCLGCHKAIPVGKQARYWFGHGVTHIHHEPGTAGHSGAP